MISEAQMNHEIHFRDDKNISKPHRQKQKQAWASDYT